jgi:type VI secretion system protein ImpH
MARAHRNWSHPVSAPLASARPSPAERLARRETQTQDAAGLGFFALLRDLERQSPEKPKIGQNTRLSDSIVRLGQDPFLTFPTSDLARVDLGATPPRVRAQFLGFFGAFGALPLTWTEEVRQWFNAGDEAFTAFTDIFTARFQELFFRAWSDAHPITQFDHPSADRFQKWILSLLGNGTAAFQNGAGISETIRLRLAPLALGRVKSPVKLRQMLQVHFSGRARIEIEELVPTWLAFEPDAISRVGRQCASLGRDVHLGRQVRSLGEKIRIHIQITTRDSYNRFLPGGPDYHHLRDIVFWYLGLVYEVEIALSLPHPEISPAQLGQSTRLGYMACIAPSPDNPGHHIRVTTFQLQPPGGPDTPTTAQAA